MRLGVSSELYSVLVLSVAVMSIMASVTASYVVIQSGARGEIWRLSRDYERVSGARLLVLDVERSSSGTRVWVYNYGWADARITSVEGADGGAVAYRLVPVLGDVEGDLIKPGGLAIIEADSTARLTIVVWGRVRIEV